MKNLTAFLVKGVFIAAYVLLFTTAEAATYYFSSSAGNDNRDNQQAQNASTPWQSLTKLNAVFSSLHAGDSILFNRNDTFYGYLNVTVSGTATLPIVLSAYGNGKPPVISGFTTLTNWSSTGNGIWEANVPAPPAMIRSVLVNGAPEAIGRYPNAGSANGGYLTIEDVPDANSITGPLLPAAGDWTSADLVIRKNHWVLDRNQVTGVTGKTIRYVSESGYGASKNYGYFIQNHRAALDQACEWYFNKGTHKLGMFFGRAGVSGFVVEVSNTNQLITINGQSYIQFNGLVCKGANEYAFDINQANHIQLKNCSILFTGNTAVHVTRSNYLSIENLTIDQTNNIACDIGNTNNLVLKNNIISNTGTIAGSGKGDSGSYEAFLLSGNNQQVEGNTISNTGYIPLTFNGSVVSVRNNFISSYGFVKDDGGGIYTWNNAANAPTHSARTIDGNIVLDGTGAPDGTEDRRRLMHGIYMDDNTDHVNIKNNTVASCSLYGIYIHNAHDLVLDGNTAFNNQGQTAMIHDNIAPQIPVSNISFTNNINFSRTADQPVALYQSIADDLPGLGTFDYNFYCRPLNEQSAVHVSWKSGGGLYDLTGWQQLFNKDPHSRKTPATIQPYRIYSLGPNKYTNGNFNNNINNLYVYSAANNAATTWSSTSPLNGGALKLSFSNLSGTGNHASVIIGIGAVAAGHHYILRYDVAGAANRYIETYLRKSLAPYNDLSERKLSRVYNTKTPCELLFTADSSSDNASVGLDITEQSGPLYIDNLQLYDAQVSITNPDDSIHFMFNKTMSALSFPLNGNYIDVKGNAYSNSISLPSFASAILIKKSLVLLPVVFSSFKAVKYDQKVTLQWTAGDTGPGITQQIERSADGQYFQKIGEQPALTQAGANEYSFTDNKPMAENYYRIRYIADAGLATYSTIVHVHFAVSETVAAQDKLQISPNPATGKMQVVFDNAFFTPCTIVLKTITGSILKSIQMERANVTVDVSFLSRGWYVISLITNSGIISKRFAKG